MDLADFLTFRATDIDTRSICTVVCKWGYLGHEGPPERLPPGRHGRTGLSRAGQFGRWDAGFYRRIGLDKLLTESKIGDRIRPMGAYIGNLTRQSAGELGLTAETAVGVGIIDAHAGGIGVVGVPLQRRKDIGLGNVLSLIAGTSTCHMIVSQKPVFVPGVWGPYYSAMIPGMWLTEGGQSSTGSLIDFVLQTNPLYDEVSRLAGASPSRPAGLIGANSLTVAEYLNKHLDNLIRQDKFLTRNLNILPYFHGNRSPRANPDARGCISGLTLNNDIDSYATLYLATIQAIAYGTRHIIEEVNRKGHRVKVISACGGLSKNRYFLQEHSNITGCEIYLPREDEAVLLGTAILAARARGKFISIQQAIDKMSSCKEVIRPDASYAAFHGRKYRVFKRMYEDQLSYNEITGI